MNGAAAPGRDAAAVDAATAVGDRSAPMRRVSFRLAEDDIQRVAVMAADAGINDSEFVRQLIRRAGDGGTDGCAIGAQPSPKRSSRRPAQIVRTIALHPDARLLLLSAGHLLNQIGRTLNTDRVTDSPMTVVSFAADLLIVQDMLHSVGEQLLQMSSVQGDPTC